MRLENKKLMKNSIVEQEKGTNRYLISSDNFKLDNVCIQNKDRKKLYTK